MYIQVFTSIMESLFIAMSNINFFSRRYIKIHIKNTLEIGTLTNATTMLTLRQYYQKILGRYTMCRGVNTNR